MTTPGREQGRGGLIPCRGNAYAGAPKSVHSLKLLVQGRAGLVFSRQLHGDGCSQVFIQAMTESKWFLRFYPDHTCSTNVMLEFLRRCVYQLSLDGAMHGSLS